MHQTIARNARAEGAESMLPRSNERLSALPRRMRKDLPARLLAGNESPQEKNRDGIAGYRIPNEEEAAHERACRKGIGKLPRSRLYLIERSLGILKIKSLSGKERVLANSPKKSIRRVCLHDTMIPNARRLAS